MSDLAKENIFGKNSSKKNRFDRFLEHQINFGGFGEVNSSLSSEQLKKIIINPSIDSVIPKFDYGFGELEKKFQKQKEIEIQRKPMENTMEKIIKLNNVYFGPKSLYLNLSELLQKKNAEKVLILSDTALSRSLQIYRNVVSSIQKEGIPIVEFTNIQPNLNRLLVFKIAEFASQHSINSIVVVGSNSTIDMAKLVLQKLIKPNMLRINKKRQQSITSPDFSLFTIPTVVVPDIAVNARSQLDNRWFLKKIDFFGDSIFLSSPIDNSDGVFYCAESFTCLDRTKQLEFLHEIFFRSILNYLDTNISMKTRIEMVQWMKTIQRYALFLKDRKKHLTHEEIMKLLFISSKTMDGTTFLDMSSYWTWFKLEANLSGWVNSKKSHGLAVFLVPFFKFEANNNSFFKKRIEELGRGLYGTISIEGFLYRAVKYMEFFNLPVSLFDIPEVTKVDYKFLSYLIRKSSNHIFSYKATKAIIGELMVW